MPGEDELLLRLLTNQHHEIEFMWGVLHQYAREQEGTGTSFCAEWWKESLVRLGTYSGGCPLEQLWAIVGEDIEIDSPEVHASSAHAAVFQLVNSLYGEFVLFRPGADHEQGEPFSCLRGQVPDEIIERLRTGATDWSEQEVEAIEVGYKKAGEVNDLGDSEGVGWGEITEAPDEVFEKEFFRILHGFKMPDWSGTQRLKVKLDREFAKARVNLDVLRRLWEPEPGARTEPLDDPKRAFPESDEGQRRANRYDALRELEPAHRKAYLSFAYAEAKAERRLEDRDAHDFLTEHGIDGAKKGDDLYDYAPPPFDTWSRYVRFARKATGEQKYTPRSAKTPTRSTTTQGESEPRGAADE